MPEPEVAQMAGARYSIAMVSGVPVVAAPEEIDVSDADWLAAVLLQAASCGHGRLVVDMTRTQFCASAGVSVLVQAYSRAVAAGGELRLVVPASAMVLRVFAIVGIDQLIPTFTSLDQALEPASAAASRPPRRRRPKPGIRTRADRQLADPGAEPGPA